MHCWVCSTPFMTCINAFLIQFTMFPSWKGFMQNSHMQYKIYLVFHGYEDLRIIVGEPNCNKHALQTQAVHLKLSYSNIWTFRSLWGMTTCEYQLPLKNIHRKMYKLQNIISNWNWTYYIELLYLSWSTKQLPGLVWVNEMPRYNGIGHIP